MSPSGMSPSGMSPSGMSSLREIRSRAILRVPFLFLFIFILSCDSSHEQFEPLDSDIAVAKKRVADVQTQIAQYNELPSLAILVRARYLIALQTLDLLEQRKHASFYQTNLEYTIAGRSLGPESDLYEKDFALQKARAKAALRRARLERIVDQDRNARAEARRWEMLLLDLQIAQIDYRLAALRYRFPEVIGGSEMDMLISDLEEKYRPQLSPLFDSKTRIEEDRTDDDSK